MQSGSFSPTVVTSPDSANYGVLHVRAGEERPHNGTTLRSDRSFSGSSRGTSRPDVPQIDERLDSRDDSQSFLSVPSVSRAISRSSSRATSTESRTAQSDGVTSPNPILPPGPIQHRRRPLVPQDTPPVQELRETDGDTSLNPGRRNRSHNPQSYTRPSVPPSPLQSSRSLQQSAMPQAVIRQPSYAASHEQLYASPPALTERIASQRSLPGPSYNYPPSLTPGQPVVSKQPSLRSPLAVPSPSLVQEEPGPGGSDPGGGDGGQGPHTPNMEGQGQSDNTPLEEPPAILCCCARLDNYLPPPWGITRPDGGNGDKPNGPQPREGIMDWIMHGCCCRCCCCH